MRFSHGLIAPSLSSGRGIPEGMSHEQFQARSAVAFSVVSRPTDAEAIGPAGGRPADPASQPPHCFKNDPTQSEGGKQKAEGRKRHPLGFAAFRFLLSAFAAVEGCAPPGLAAKSPVQPASRDYPDWPVGLKLGGKLLDTQEVVTNKAAAAAAGRRRFRLRLTGTGSIQVSLNMS